MYDESESIGWYVLQLKPNGLSLAKTHLARQGFETLMPLREVTLHSRYGLRTVKQALFPGYLFFALQDGSINWRAVSKTRGVTRVITGTAGKPAPMPPSIVQGLLNMTTEDGMLDEAFDYAVGDHVGVISGPFAGWLAKVISADETGRIQLLIDVMGRATTVNISGRDLEKRR